MAVHAQARLEDLSGLGLIVRAMRLRRVAAGLLTAAASFCAGATTCPAGQATGYRSDLNSNFQNHALMVANPGALACLSNVVSYASTDTAAWSAFAEQVRACSFTGKATTSSTTVNSYCVSIIAGAPESVATNPITIGICGTGINDLTGGWLVLSCMTTTCPTTDFASGAQAKITGISRSSMNTACRTGYPNGVAAWCELKPSTAVTVYLRDTDALGKNGEWDGTYKTFGKWQFTGQQCPGPNYSKVLTTTDDCVTSASGVSVCKSSDPGCGYFNGERKCSSDFPLPGSGSCVTTAKGNTFCVTDGPQADPYSPPAPLANPDAVLEFHGATSGTSDDIAGAVVYYGNQTAQNGDGPNQAPGEGSGAVCGAPPLPACAVKVDEGGTPSGDGLISDGELVAAFGSLNDELASKGAVAAVDRSLVPALWSVSECQSLTLTFWLGITKEFPGQWCPKIDVIRDVLGWLIGVVVFWFLGRKVMDAI